MGKYKTFEDLEVYKKSMDLVEKIYSTSRLPSFSKDFGLVDQIRRASVSIPSNIAEGMERDGNKELINFLYIAKGSCGEVECQLQIAERLGYIDHPLYTELYNFVVEIAKALGKMILYLKESDFKGKKYK